MAKNSDFLSAGVQDGLVDKNEHLRDNRTTISKLKDFYKSPAIASAILFYGFTVVCLFMAASFSDTVYAIVQQFHLTAASEAIFILFFFFPSIRMYFASWDDHLYAIPFNDPKCPDDLTDRGNFVLGKSRRTGVITAFSKAMLMTHTLIFGGTGSGKSETIFTMLFNALMSGSGGVLSDGKADANLPIRVAGLCRRIGREQDILTLSYIMGSKGQRKMRTPVARSNTMNPLVKGSASFCSEFMLSLMTSSEGDNAIFSKRAEAFVKAYMRLMEFLRDAGRMKPFIGEFAEDISLLKKLATLCADKTIPAEVRRPMRNYLITTGGTMDDVIKSMENGGQAMPIKPDVEKQHGFISMQLIEPLSILGQDYGHIFNVREYDIDMLDVMVNRRVLIVLIPALEKSQESLQGLGKVVIASMKALLGEIMDGGNLTGTVDNIVNKRPTNSPMAFPAILDEVGYYMVPGIAVIPAQARSLGVGFVFAGQDKPAFTKLVDTEADSIIANTLIKMTGILEDESTGDIFIKRAGKTKIVETTGSSMKENALGNHRDEGSAKITEVDRLDIRDLYRQTAGQFLVMNKDRFDFVQVMYTGTLRTMSYHQINQKVPMPSLVEEEVETYLKDTLEQEGTLAKFMVEKPEVVSATPLDIKMKNFYDVMYVATFGNIKPNSSARRHNEDGGLFSKKGVPDNIKAAPRSGDDDHIDVFSFMDEKEVAGALDGMSKASKEIDPDSENSTDGIIEISRAQSKYPEKHPFKGDKGKRGSLLSGFVKNLESKVNTNGDDGVPNDPDETPAAPIPRKKAIGGGMVAALAAKAAEKSAAQDDEEPVVNNGLPVKDDDLVSENKVPFDDKEVSSDPLALFGDDDDDDDDDDVQDDS